LFDVEQSMHSVRHQTDKESKQAHHCLMPQEYASSRPGYAFYRDVFGGWRWEYYHRNGEAVDSRESFNTREACIENAGAAGLGGAVVALPVKHAYESRRSAYHAKAVEHPRFEKQTKRVA
jgi:hypothetical protein